MSLELIAMATGLVAIMAVVSLTVILLRGRKTGSHDEVSAGLGELRRDLSGRDGALDARVDELNAKLASMQESLTSREATLEEHVRGLGAQMQGIAGLFTNDRARGGWGEVSMLRIFELGGLMEGKDFTAHFHSNNGTPDAVVHLPGDRSIVIDSKFPIARYNEALAAEDDAKRRRLLLEQGKELERVGKSLVDKGYQDLASGGYVIMYLPSQAVYEASAAVSHDVIERLMENRVVVAGPTALFALIMNVSALVTEHRALQQADQLLDEARELNRRIATFVGHLTGIGAALEKTVRAFNGAVGSWTSRVAPQLNRVSELGGSEEVVPLEPVDESIRLFEPRVLTHPGRSRPIGRVGERNR